MGRRSIWNALSPAQPPLAGASKSRHSADRALPGVTFCTSDASDRQIQPLKYRDSLTHSPQENENPARSSSHGQVFDTQVESRLQTSSMTLAPRLPTFPASSSPVSASAFVRHPDHRHSTPNLTRTGTHGGRPKPKSRVGPGEHPRRRSPSESECAGSSVWGADPQWEGFDSD